MAKHSVVVYGASGYTGMLTMDWLIDQNIPFTAVSRNAARTLEMMKQRSEPMRGVTLQHFLALLWAAAVQQFRADIVQ